MKKFIVLIIFLFLFSSTINNVFAQDIVQPNSFAANIEYELPYPGILPDNPLYFLKAVRDNVLGFLISDSLRKADFQLLQADKRLAASKALLDKKKYDLAITTLSKSGNYFDQAISKAAEAKGQGENADSLIARLLEASKKHQQVIYQMELKAKDQTRYNLGLLEIRTKTFQDKAELLSSK